MGAGLASGVGSAHIQRSPTVTGLGRWQGLAGSWQVNSLRGSNAKFPADRLPYVVAVVYEFAEFRAADAPPGSDERKGRQAVVARLEQVGRLGRAVGIHLIACTQRPDAETITRQLRARFPRKVAFYVTDAMKGRVISGRRGGRRPAASLPPPWLTRGRAVWKGESAQMVEFQVP